uniref:Uncharacterized protein n=1 Tax=Knipowitschia caucasica TaxID=637954 RepID=A0AAV2JDX5_KNICA
MLIGGRVAVTYHLPRGSWTSLTPQLSAAVGDLHLVSPTAPPLHPDSLHPDSLHPDSQHPDSQHPDSQHPDSQHPDSQHPVSSSDSFILTF